jgi:D-threo-aldose 1-dehydrogenase
LEAAWDFGYRHFDVAPLYGLGAAEEELGAFLSSQRSESTIATKIGRAPTTWSRRLNLVQRPLRSALRRFPALRRTVQRHSAAAASDVPLDPAVIEQSIRTSLARLGVGSVDVFFLHNVPLSRLSADALEALGALPGAGLVGRLGIAGPTSVVAQSIGLPASRLIRAIQTNDSLTPMAYDVGDDVAWFHYGVLSQHLGRLSGLLSDDRTVRELEDLAGLPLRTATDLACLLVRTSAATRPGATVLIGSTNVDHLQSIRRSLDIEPAGESELRKMQAILSSWEG